MATENSAKVDETKKQDCKDCTFLCYCPIITGIISGILLVLTVVVYFIFLHDASDHEILLQELETSGTATNCRYTLDYNATAAKAYCWYRPERTECTQSGKSQNCNTIPAQMECECPVLWNHVNADHTYLTILPESFNTESEFEDEHFTYLEAMRDYNVNLLKLCASAEVCHRFDCSENDKGCCALGMSGHPEGFQDYCGDDCYARINTEFDCMTVDAPDYPGHVTLFGGTLKQLRSWFDEHLNFFTQLCLLLGSTCFSLAFMTIICARKACSNRRNNQGRQP